MGNQVATNGSSATATAVAPTVLGAPDPMDMTDRFNTKLSPAQETEYQKSHSPNDSYDYDMRGAFKEGIGAAGNGHYPDTYKKPNHPTFSNESIYHGQSGAQGGQWGKNTAGADTFTPGPTNIETHGKDGLKSYFDRVEPNVQLIF